MPLLRRQLLTVQCLVEYQMYRFLRSGSFVVYEQYIMSPYHIYRSLYAYYDS